MRPSYGHAYRTRGHGGSQQPNYLFWILLARLHQQISELEYKPPVTLALIAVNFGIFFKELLPLGLVPELQPLLSLIPGISAGCLRPAAIFQRRQWGRLFWAALLHGDEWHLYYNMSSLLWKGVQLEASMGSASFAALVGELWLSSHLLLCAAYWVARAHLWRVVPGLAEDYHSVCAVGFSAILFGLKTVINARSTGWQEVHVPFVGRVSLPPKYVSWVELVVIQMLVPNASFVGHLSGICAGLLHVYGSSHVLRWLRQRIAHERRRASRPQPGTARPRFYGGGPSGYRSQRH